MLSFECIISSDTLNAMPIPPELLVYGVLPLVIVVAVLLMYFISGAHTKHRRSNKKLPKTLSQFRRGQLAKKESKKYAQQRSLSSLVIIAFMIWPQVSGITHPVLKMTFC